MDPAFFYRFRPELGSETSTIISVIIITIFDIIRKVKNEWKIHKVCGQSLWLNRSL